MLDRKKLKEKLLATSLFVENEYFEQYLDLIISNNTRVLSPFTTQSHHIIPKSYFQHFNIEIDSSEDKN